MYFGGNTKRKNNCVRNGDPADTYKCNQNIVNNLNIMINKSKQSLQYGTLGKTI